MPRPLATLLLIITTVLWGFAFVAQKTAMSGMGPFTFSAVRYALGALVILPLAGWELKRVKPAITRRHWGAVAVLCLSFFLGVYLQQVGLTMTTATNGGFLTSLYVLIVPLLAIVVFRRLPHRIIWIGMPIAIIGVFLLNGGRLDRFTLGDLFVVGCAICWAVQVLLLGDIARSTKLPITVSVLCFAATALLSTVGTLTFEHPDLNGVAAGWLEILYTGILSTAVAFTLQAIAQQYVPPANAAIILSAESLFAALGGAWLLAERLPPVGYLGAAMIFVAIVLVETVPALIGRRDEGVTGQPVGHN